MNKKNIFISLITIIVLITSGFYFTNMNNQDIKDTQTGVETEDQEFKQVNNYSLEEALELEKEGSFNFFWEQTQLDENSKGYGLIRDRFPGSTDMASIASVGFGLTAYIIGVENGYVTYEEALERSLKTLKSMKELKREHGFYYHFYSMETGEPLPSEVSNVDTAIFLNGALIAGKYFGGEVEQIANEIYKDVEWPWFFDQEVNQFYMAYYPNKGFEGHWDFYAEQLMMYVLAAGSPTYPVGIEAYNGFIKNVGKYDEFEFIHSWFGSIFTYQFSHAWIDFRNIEDQDGINWFENSVDASLANYAYSQKLSNRFDTINEYVWGFTACDAPKGYNGLFGAPPTGYDNNSHKNDGTIPPAGALGSIVFTEELAEQSLLYYYNYLGDNLIGKYGLKDAFNFENNLKWFASDVIGIDKGITLLMIENYQTELVWDIFMEIDYIQNGLNKLGFK